MINKKLFKRLFIFLFILLLLAVLIWVFLAKVLRKVSFENKNTLNYKNAGTEVSINPSTTPNDFPKDFPIYPNSKVISSWKSEADSTNGFSLVLETPDTLEKVSSFYDSELVKEGFVIDKPIKESNSLTLSFNKNSSKGFIGLVENAGKVIISLSLGIA